MFLAHLDDRTDALVEVARDPLEDIAAVTQRISISERRLAKLVRTSIPRCSRFP